MSQSPLKNRTVRLSDAQIKGLKAVAKKTKRKYTEVIRIAVDELIERHPEAREKAAA
jgi:predicted transcriptional regulator